MTTIERSGERPIPTSTVGRRRAVEPVDSSEVEGAWSDDLVSVRLGDSLNLYGEWDTPTAIVSDGGYGVLGFEG